MYIYIYVYIPYFSRDDGLAGDGWLFIRCGVPRTDLREQASYPKESYPEGPRTQIVGF